MCKDTNETAKHAQFNKANRRMAALAAISRLDEEAKAVAQIRKAFEATREQHRRNAEELVATEQLIEQMEEAIIDEAMTVAELEEEHEHDCGCTNEDAEPVSFEDEELARDHEAAPARVPLRRSAITPLIFGALGVACAVASMVARTIADEHKE